MYNQLEFVKYLVEHGVDVNYSCIDGTSAINFASAKGNLEIVKYLVEHGADVFNKDYYSNIPLAQASKELNYDVVEYLLGVMRNKK